MPAKIRKDPLTLRREISPKVRKETREDLIVACTNAEQKTASKAVEFVAKIADTTTWTLDDWVELSDLAGQGRYFHEIRLAFTEIDEVEAVAVPKEEYSE